MSTSSPRSSHSNKSDRSPTKPTRKQQRASAFANLQPSGMTPIDWSNRSNNGRMSGGPWGRFGEPSDPSYNSPRDESLKLPRRPRRKGSFDDVDIDDEEKSPIATRTSPRTTAVKPPITSTEVNNVTRRRRTSAPLLDDGDMMLSNSSNHSTGSHGRPGRRRRSSFRRLRTPMDFEIPSIETSVSDDLSSRPNSYSRQNSWSRCNQHPQTSSTQQPQPQGYHQQHLQEVDDDHIPATIRRRISTGSRNFLESIKGSLAVFGGGSHQHGAFDSDPHAPQKPRRVSISGPRPCMESSLQGNADGPIMRRRVSLGGTRPCMENTRDNNASEAPFDGPMLRPYRQLSSEDLCIDMCIGEETDEDLSNRSMLRTADLSGRSNRSNYAAAAAAVAAEFSNRSNRSFAVADFSNRSNRSSFVPAADFSNRSNRSCLPPNGNATEFSNRSNRSVLRTADFSNRSRVTALAPSEFLSEQVRASPVNEEGEPTTSTHMTINKDQDHTNSTHMSLTTSSHDTYHRQNNTHSSSSKDDNRSKPESWPQ